MFIFAFALASFSLLECLFVCAPAISKSIPLKTSSFIHHQPSRSHSPSISPLDRNVESFFVLTERSGGKSGWGGWGGINKTISFFDIHDTQFRRHVNWINFVLLFLCLFPVCGLNFLTAQTSRVINREWSGERRMRSAVNGKTFASP